ncbi:non-hydrolyzing UDP-N-acetylglucosamine 2-epimerase [Ideonella sp. BN130291]|uniref:non-hydrolyzing UDP-N-acetylglucosamine 2-epimerase n=1 Tax=Ideonella sp. BN130291 TaxID=3112940 RepID=UPI002E25F734|nr:UDP-N-acetylglucosamine 2-epimerase (non-hydrolyzing) [Ideonella sp. BN130291]
MRVATIFGTRPEAIKLAPLCFACERAGVENHVIVTAQHRELLDRALADFSLVPAHDLNVMRPNQDLFHTTSAVLLGLRDLYRSIRPDWVFVQGDTTTTFAGALAAFYERIPVAHVEAGLRTGERYSPFPEEMNRRMAGVLADMHFAPTSRARENLLREGVAERDVLVTGNTGIDALLWILENRKPDLARSLPPAAAAALGSRFLLLTTHRRESFGGPMLEALSAVRDVCEATPDLHVIFPVHPNPNVRAQVAQALPNVRNVHLIDPLDYVTFSHLMARATVIVTDSGGIQEEAPTLSRPVVVLRESTERPEGVEAGVAVLAGTRRDRVRDILMSLLHDESRYLAMTGKPNPYGDGHASDRIVAAVLERQRQRSAAQ